MSDRLEQSEQDRLPKPKAGSPVSLQSHGLVSVTRSLRGNPALPEMISASCRRHRERDVWQRRFWEHQIRDKRDFAQPVDTIHFNPVSHGLVTVPKDWPDSSFHRYMRDGCHPIDWGADGAIAFPSDIGHE